VPGWRAELGAGVDRLQASPAYGEVRDFLPELRPAWWVLWAGLGLALIQLARRLASRPRREDALATRPILKQQ
ncbi:MAG: hypothetical protein NTZ14_08710, partial [Hyphomicrobiales bacterium]|nr:hypothetical protein [Hyphomicrobiales bacterium]